jgi:hypothetical protein
MAGEDIIRVVPTLMQKIRLALRGWSRRREEKNRAFVAQSSWSSGGQPPPAVPDSRQAGLPVLHVDIDGLTVAYLDGSGRTTYYLDTQSGDVIESNVQLDSMRYKAIPTASAEADRMAFLGTIKNLTDRARLAPPESFREVLARDRALERAWYNFRNDRAIATIQRWLRELGL